MKTKGSKITDRSLAALVLSLIQNGSGTYTVTSNNPAPLNEYSATIEFAYNDGKVGVTVGYDDDADVYTIVATGVSSETYGH